MLVWAAAAFSLQQCCEGASQLSTGKLTVLPVEQIELDKTNPRIRRFLESYTGEPTYDRIALALDVAASGDDGSGATTPEKLRNSILTNGGIMQPIIVNKEASGRLICIEGNTRLYIYRSFVTEQVEGDWTMIPVLLHEGLQAPDIDAIRLQAHLVGPRPWDAYSKAKYLWELQHRELMPLERIIAFCGGNRRDVTQAIQAYSDMETYYRPICEADDYETENYSGFVEVQNTRIKDSILRAGFSLKDFAQWLREGKFKNLQYVRQLPKILPDKRTRDVFLKKGMKAALDVVERPELNAGIKNATISQLARALTEAANSIRIEELRRLQENPDDEALRYIEDALEALQYLTKQIQSGA
jgi:hypothetical protein